MNSAEFIGCIRSMRVMTVGGLPAPHKPLLMLLALRRLLEGKRRLTPYVEIEEELVPLLKRFHGRAQRQHPEAPFGWLRTDGLWEIPNGDNLPVNDRGTLHRHGLVDAQAEGGFPPRVRAPPPPAGLVDAQAEGGFPQAVYDLLRSDHFLVNQAIAILHMRHLDRFPLCDILEAVGLANFDVTRSRPRDPQFRSLVLREYNHICAICGYNVKVDNNLFGLDAAHIQWHAHGGSNKVSNGLALCTFHHRAFDAGVIGLDMMEDGFHHLLVSSRIHGQNDTLNQLRRFHRQPIRPPRSRDLSPDPESVSWHTWRIFKHPPMNPDIP